MRPRYFRQRQQNAQLLELPTFSGHRRDWPEFKTVWRSVAESALRNKTALAHELKRLNSICNQTRGL